ncbi:hypothetical protein EG829_18680, partial [bacterium]|nr:hypothetical protein [bacterium]
MKALNRRDFIGSVASSVAATAALGLKGPVLAQSAGERPQRAKSLAVLNPRGRVPIGLIIDDSTCLVNLNRFAIPQFDEAHQGNAKWYKRDWKEWPVEIPDTFVRKFGEWCAEAGVKGKYSVVPYPACVGRLDRELPGWSRKEVRESIKLVKDLLTPNWDIHPEMVTHTRVIDLKTGHPYPDYSLKFMENWEWTTGKSVDELSDYMVYALSILKSVGFECEGITTPGGFGNRVLPELAQASLRSVREVFSAEVPHYFRHLYDEGTESVAPRVEYATDLGGTNPHCVVSIIGCTGDWTGGWDCTTPEGSDRFITPDLAKGRMVEVIERGEPAMMVCHWTGIYWNGRETGFKVFQEVVRRLQAKYSKRTRWMKLSELARYWAAKGLTDLRLDAGGVRLRAAFAWPE